MCGIVGFTRQKTDRERDAAILEKMSARIAHRGPNDEGRYADAQIMLGFRRLSIIDLDTGQQPIFNEDKSIVLMCNGEIYNHQDLRDSLEKKGHVFRSSSDSEVIVHLYEEEGEKFLSLLDGMFFICLWDTRTNTLLLARDRVGIKPLYYSWDGENIIFSSELKAFRECPHVSTELDFKAIGQYFTLNYIPYPLTIFENVKKMASGNFLVYRNKTIFVQSYSNFSEIEADQEISFQDAKTMLREKLLTAVDKRLMSDVPLGVLLSGGLDSSALVAMLDILGRKDIPTFSVSFKNDPEHDEASYSRLVADRFKTNHTVLGVEADCLDLFEDVVFQMDEPMGDKALIPSLLIFREASKYVKVILSGEGADELFGGYKKYLWLMKIPDRGISFLGHIAALCKSSRRISKLLELLSLPLSPSKIIAWDRVFREPELQQLCKDYTALSCDSVTDFFTRSSSKSLLRQSMEWDFSYFLPEDLLMKVDKLSMAHGLEARVPYLDADLVQFVSSLPMKYKIKNRTSKIILKEIVRDVLPASIIDRKKQGFTLPIKKWLADEKNPLVQKYLSPEKIGENNFFHTEEVQKMVRAHQMGKGDYTRQLWNLLTFQAWMKQNGFN